MCQQIQIHELKIGLRQNNFEIFGVVEARSEKPQTTVLLITPVSGKRTLEEMNDFFRSVAKVAPRAYDAVEFELEDGQIWFGTIQIESFHHESQDGKVVAFDHIEIIVLPHDNLLERAKGHERHWISSEAYERILYPPKPQSWFRRQ